MTGTTTQKRIACLVCGAESRPIPQCLETVFGEYFSGVCCEKSLEFLSEAPQLFVGESVEDLVKNELRIMVN